MLEDQMGEGFKKFEDIIAWQKARQVLIATRMV